jgi:hypothetical protein
MTQDASPINVLVDRKHIWPSGKLGKVTLRQEFGSDIDLTLDQAKALITVLHFRLEE